MAREATQEKWRAASIQNGLTKVAPSSHSPLKPSSTTSTPMPSGAHQARDVRFPVSDVAIASFLEPWTGAASLGFAAAAVLLRLLPVHGD